MERSGEGKDVENGSEIRRRGEGQRGVRGEGR